ncbi:LysR family transcriptional regulator [Aestuariibacter sp. GS-14]|nr:LysR family transcriptional regulator [Aestuariibacter sp. GS-14]
MDGIGKTDMLEKKVTSSLNLFHLRVFLTVYDIRSISKTAELLGRSQPAISQAINSLEHTFDAKFFHRSTKGITATDEATTLCRRVKRALNSLDSFFDLMLKNFGQVPKNVSRHITMTQLNALKAVAEAGSFSAGAAISNKANPTIHRAARDLEQTVNVNLFERTSFGIKPTKVAIQLAQVAGVMEREIELAFAEIAKMSHMEKGNTAIGAMPMARSYIIPKAATDFKLQYPGHKISIVEGSYEYLLHDLMRGKLDILVGASRLLPEGIEIKEEPILTESIVLLMSRHHPLARENNLAVETLLTYPWILPRTSSPLRKTYEALFREHKVLPPENVIECNSLSASRVILENSPSLMLLSEAQARHELMSETMVSKQINGFNAQRTIVLQYREDSILTQTQLALLNHIKHIAQSESSVIE